MVNYNFALGVILFIFLSQAPVQSQNVVKRSPDPTYVTLGDSLVLNVTYDITGQVGVAWSNSSGKTLYLREITGGVLNLDKRASLEGQATLIIKNTALYDNGTYTVQVTSLTTTLQRRTFDVIIQVQPTATLNDSNTITVPEHSDVYYSCEGKNGVPASNESWYKGKKLVVKGKILSLRNIKGDQAGSYTCKVQSGTLTDETVLVIIVQFKPNITTLKSVPDIAIITESVKITCKAEGLPEPTYVIYHNGTKLTDKGEITINPVKYSDQGEYRCNATNKLGKDSDSYFLKVKEKSTGQPTTKLTTSISPNPSETTKKPVGTAGGGSDSLEGWVIAVIVIGVLLVILAIVFLIGCKCGWETFCCCKGIGECSVFCCCKRNGGCSKNAEREQIPEHAAGGSGADSLPRANDDNQYESVDQEKLRRAAEANSGKNSGAASGSLPPVYAVVDKDKKKREKERKEKEKEKRAPQPTYASLDPVALQPDSSNMRDRSREETNYASINLDSLQSDLV